VLLTHADMCISRFHVLYLEFSFFSLDRRTSSLHSKRGALGRSDSIKVWCKHGVCVEIVR
jgi:hypothetical protein